MGPTTYFHYKTLFSVARQILTDTAEISHDRCQPHPVFFAGTISAMYFTHEKQHSWGKNVFVSLKTVSLYYDA